MAVIRFRALEQVFSRKPMHITPPSDKISDYFAVNVFDRAKMQKYLSKDAFEHVMEAIDRGTPIDRKMADIVATGMKAWAMERGVTHYTHWFQPLTGGTAEKHDAFICQDRNGGVVEIFSGEALVQQEPDASSFPSGGIRNTFEARGYTAWDPSSPAFIIEKTLSIPTIFISYTGDALDHKTPLLKALNAVDKAATEVCRMFDKDVKKVQANLGWEQEYFLVDEALYYARPDLALTGRTLMGHASAKDQQLDDHYFGSVPERVSAFMHDLEFEAYKLGIPVKTRHNEVAPNQYEIAPIFEECNLAVDHNVLIMDLMKKISRHHGFRVLFHEKPFKGINGSGKHNNWSLSTDTGIILHKPGKNPRSNLQFLTFVVNTIKAVYDYQDLLRASIASASNAHRLGANEAPPAILSCFLGSEVSAMLDQLEEQVSSKKMSPDEKTALKLDIGRIPEILLDNTDRNRTSPFAFTGNRFEFRAVGSSSNPAAPMTVLNTAVAAELIEFNKEVNALIKKGIKKDEAIFQVLRKYIIASRPIRFEGDNYSEKWIQEAEKRGLTNITDVPEALSGYISEKSKDLFLKLGIFSERELEARVEVLYEQYTLKIQIEARVLGDLSINHVVPTAVKYQSILLENVIQLKELYGDSYAEFSGNRTELIKEISHHITEIKSKVNNMVDARKVANKIQDSKEKAIAYSKTVAPLLDLIRYHIDKLELVVDDEIWPLPKFRELLFIS
ncbi:MAG: glutamine synthetase III [Bacteroidales bacterium]|nr:glutamine synthetase III [Bacteroidales bacterium]MBN2697182.1 glutamine synthetase III [Bacteroidales bacterium]